MPIKKPPETYHRVQHPRLDALKAEHRVECPSARMKDGFCYWPLARARYIAGMFAGATVDPVGLYAEDFEKGRKP